MVIMARNIKKYIVFAGIGIIFGVTVKFIPTISQSVFFESPVVICDAGHGTPDGGAVGINGTLEKDVNLAITLKLQEILEGQGINVVLTRDTDSGLHDNSGSIHDMKVMDMNKRLDIMKNSNADLFVSIHMNSFSDSSVNGLHIFYDIKHEEIKPLAEEIMNELSHITQASSHETKPASKTLYLMKNAPLPAILIECGFLSNSEEEQKLNDEEYQSKIAWAIAKSIKNYYTK